MGDVIKDFIKYWDEWHEEWYSKCAKNTNPHQRDIKGWLIPRRTNKKSKKVGLEEISKLDLISILKLSNLDYDPKNNKSQLEEIIHNNFKKLNIQSKEIYFAKYSPKETKYHLKKNEIPKELPIHLAIPEPYWISKAIINKDCNPRAVFFNINPGPNKFYHLIDSTELLQLEKNIKHLGDKLNKLEKDGKKSTDEYKKLKTQLCNEEEIKRLGAFNQDHIWEVDKEHNRDIHNWSKIYNPKTKKPKYSVFINELIKTYSDENKFWHCSNRLKWVNEFEESMGNHGGKKIQLQDIATFEYFPFHTNEASEIESNWINNKAHIRYLLDPAIYLSRKVRSEELKNKIISRGHWNKGWKNYFENIAKNWKIFNKRIVVYPINNREAESKGSTPYTLNICYDKNREEDPVFFLNFDGGGANGMSLPTLESKKAVCFIEINGDKYISIYFDEFMREIHKYIS